MTAAQSRTERAEKIAETIGISMSTTKEQALAMANMLKQALGIEDKSDDDDTESDDDADGDSHKSFNSHPHVTIDYTGDRFVVKVSGLPKAEDHSIIEASFFTHLAKKLKHYHVRGRRKKVEEQTILTKKPYWGQCPCFFKTSYYMAFSYVIQQSEDGTLQVEFFPNSAFLSRWQGKNSRAMTHTEIKSAMMNDVLLPYEWSVKEFLSTLKKPEDAFLPYNENPQGNT